jgi:hypothetical protein
MYVSAKRNLTKLPKSPRERRCDDCGRSLEGLEGAGPHAKLCPECRSDRWRVQLARVVLQRMDPDRKLCPFCNERPPDDGSPFCYECLTARLRSCLGRSGMIPLDVRCHQHDIEEAPLIGVLEARKAGMALARWHPGDNDREAGEALEKLEALLERGYFPVDAVLVRVPGIGEDYQRVWVFGKPLGKVSDRLLKRLKKSLELFGGSNDEDGRAEVPLPSGLFGLHPPRW